MPQHDLRYNPAADGPRPATGEEARRALLEGNRRFSEWINTCRAAVHQGGAEATADQVNELVLSCGGLASILSFAADEYPTQKPFAVVVGCSDARAPMEMVLGQGYNDLFVIRNAGNVMSDVASGSVDFTLNALADSVRAIVVMGHTGCGAVSGAVASYLDPTQYWSKAISPNLRVILQRIFVAVRESDRAIRRVWGADAATDPNYGEALKEACVHLNAAYTAFEVRRDVEASGVEGIDVFHAVYDVRSHLVRTPPRRDDPEGGRQGLTPAAREPEELSALARQMAEALRSS